MSTLDIYADSDLAKSLVDHGSTSGYCSFIGWNLITQKIKKHDIVSRSSTEAKLWAFVQGLSESVWIKGILKDLKIIH